MARLRDRILALRSKLLSFGVRSKIIGIVIAVVAVFSLGVLVLTRTEMGAGLRERLDELGVVLARDVANQSTTLVLTGDTFDLHELIRQTLDNHRDVRYVFIVDARGQVLGHSFPARVPQGLLALDAPDGGDLPKWRTIRTEEGLIRDVAVPIAGGAAGIVHIGMSEKRSRAAMVKVTTEIAALSLAALCAGAFVAFLLAGLIVRPIFDLRRAARAIAAGDLSVRTPIFAEDETGELCRAFNLMADELQKRREEVTALEKRLRAENIYLREELAATTRYEYIVGANPKLMNILAAVDKAARTDSTVLVLGESGTGKELIARALHERSPRGSNTLIKVNCAAIPPGLIESELFGHEKGAFTGAVKTHMGKFELAHGSTLFLDEIADLSPEAQAKLLQFLQDSVFTRVGGNEPIKVDVRVVAATNRDLALAVNEGRFRLDLYHRIKVIELTLPPLRERLDDVPALAFHFLRNCLEKIPSEVEAISEEALALLCSYHWPGNIRELENVIERAVVLCRGKTIMADHLPAELRTRAAPPVQSASGSNGRPTLANAIRAEKIRRVKAALAEAGGNRARAARLLGIDRSNLTRLMKSLGI